MTGGDGIRYGINVLARGQVESANGWGLPAAVDGRNGYLDAALLEAGRVNAARHQAIIEDAYGLEGAGCRAVALDPPSVAFGRGIVILHEWPPRSISRILFRSPRCYCGESRG